MKSRHVLTLASLAALGLLVFGYRGRDAGPGREDAELAAVRAVIEAQQAAWNRGDIEGFMDGYAREETTTFISGDDFTRGWQTVFERYRKRYDSPAKMGRLTFSELEMTETSKNSMVVFGRWRLDYADGRADGGLFTLLFERRPTGWRIVADHTSSQ